METTIKIPFPFPLQDNDEADPYECIAFWDSPSTVEWFRQRGYTLYKRHVNEWNHPWYTEPTLSCPDPCRMQYPFSHYESEENAQTALRTNETGGKIVFAQETLDPSHHVAIKLVVTDSEEHRILRFLQSQGTEVLEENCLISVLDILPNGSFSFVVMPRWGGVIHLPKARPIKNTIRIMHSLLKALVFLHKNNIIHRDLKFANVLVSHFGDDPTLYQNSSVRERLHWSDELVYCLFDFDISMMFPPDTDKARIRLPYNLSWDGTYCQPRDTRQGEFDYDPFAYDVGTLGKVFCVAHQHLVPEIPILAPFMDRMVTRNIPLRFTAAGALQFFEAHLLEIPESVMNCEYPESPGSLDYEHDRWEGLPPDFIKKWEAYREPPVPFWTSVLRWIYLCQRLRMPYILPAVRLFFFRITSVPSRIGIFLRKVWAPPLR